MSYPVGYFVCVAFFFHALMMLIRWTENSNLGNYQKKVEFKRLSQEPVPEVTVAEC